MNGLDLAQSLDDRDPLAALRDRFAIPEHDGRPAVYLAGHSLGLMPLSVPKRIAEELSAWATRGVDAHFGTDGGWYAYHERFAEPLAQLVGARPDEVVAMNSLTVNLHLMMVSFFRPTGAQHKVLIESGAFPSDRYAVQSHLQWHGLDPVRDLIEFEGNGGLLDADGLDRQLTAANGEVALVLLPGVQFLSGQCLDIGALTEVAHAHASVVGLDLAHAIGNVTLDLAATNADFAVWCSYKYLNAGPGAVGGCYVNRTHHDQDLPRFAGWWGHDASQRFELQQQFRPMKGAPGWQLSNPPILAMAPLAASLELFGEAGSERLAEKSHALTDFLESQLSRLGQRIRIVTPHHARGAQLSVELNVAADRMAYFVEQLRARGILVDWRRPNVLRLAPVPLYNRFTDVHEAVEGMREVLATL